MGEGNFFPEDMSAKKNIVEKCSPRSTFMHPLPAPLEIAYAAGAANEGSKMTHRPNGAHGRRTATVGDFTPFSEILLGFDDVVHKRVQVGCETRIESSHGRGKKRRSYRSGAVEGKYRSRWRAYCKYPCLWRHYCCAHPQ